MPKVLIFESDSAFADELKSGLERHSCSVTVVGDATEGLQVAATYRPDLVLLTVELPRINGFSVCNKLKRDPGLKSVPLIIMSSDSNEDTFTQHRRLKNSRAEDYVHKPVSFAELLPRIRSLVAIPDESGATDEVVRIHEEPARADSYLDLDDELEELDSEDTELDGEYEAELEVVESVPPEAHVDAEVDEFTEHAFDALLDEDLLAAQSDDDPDTKVDATRSVFPPSGTPVPPTSVTPISLISEAPRSRPAPRASSDPAPRRSDPMPKRRSEATVTRISEVAAPRLSESQALAALDPAAVAEKDQVISELEGLLGAANADVELQKTEVLRLRRELESVRSEHTGGGSAQDFLSLREALNKKDKELLDLHGHVSQKSKELLAVKDASLGYEREKTDAIDRLIAMERELHELNRVHAAAKADKEQAAKRADDFKRRAEKLAGELQEREQTLSGLKSELETLERSRVTQLAEVAQHSEARLALAEQEKESALAATMREAEERRTRELDLARAEAERQLSAQLEHERTSAERNKNSALEHQEARLRTEYEQAFATLVDEKTTAFRNLETERDAALGRAARELEGAHAMARELEEELRVARQETSAVREELASVLGALEREKAQLVSTRNDFASVLDQLEATRATLAGAHADLATLGTELDSVQRDLSQVRSELATTRSELQETQSELGASHVRVQRLEGSLHETNAELTTARSDLSQLQGDFARAHATATAALSKWEQDRDALHKGREALEAALEQLSQIENRPLN